jgi:hypothetical protein
MAFGFFRRRQKMVIIIMVILMVSFLVGYQGFEMVFNRNQDPVIGRMADEKITHSMLVSADSDVKTMERLEQKSTRLQAEFFPLMRDNRAEHDSALAFVLLLTEAKKANVHVSSGEVEASIDLLAKEWGAKNLPDGTVDRESFYAVMRDSQTPKPNIISALTHWLMIYKNFEANQLRVPPSQPELQRLYRDAHEKIAVRLVTLKAADFMDKVREPGESDLQTLFQKYQKNIEGDVSTGGNEFGFGYVQPNRASVQYLLLRDSVVKRGSQPTDQAIKQYFLDNQAKYDRRKKQLSEVKDEIAESLRDRVEKTHADSVLSQADSLINAALPNSEPSKNNVYEEVKAAMALPADEVLATPLKDVHMDGTVEQVISQLAKQAELNAIVYPYDVPGEVNIDSALHVTLDEAQITLGEALQKITDKVMGPQGPASSASAKAAAPKIVWKMCKGFDGVIFPVGPGNLDLFPLQVGETGLKSPQDMSEDPIVGNASAGTGGTRLWQVVFNSPVFKTANPSSVTVGSIGQPMVSNAVDKTGMRGGQPQPQGTLLWRMSQAKVNYVPELKDLQTNPQLRAQVVKDWKDREAYGLALEEAKKITDSAKKQNLEAAIKGDDTAKKLKLKTQETKPFSRRLINLPQVAAGRRVSQRVQFEMMMSGKQFSEQEVEQEIRRAISANMPQILSMPPLEVDLGDPGAEMDLGASKLSVQQFIDSAFTLSPANVEPPYKDKAPVVLAELKLSREVAVMERSDFVPAVMGEYEGIVTNPAVAPASTLANLMVEQQEWQAQRLWFFMGSGGEAVANVPNIIARTEYKKEQQGQ